MAKVVISNSISLDGFIAGPGDGKSNPLGDGGGDLFRWYFAGTKPYQRAPFFKPLFGADSEVLDEAFDTLGCVLNGRRTYDIAGGWKGTHPVNAVPVVILTHVPPIDPPKGQSEIIFVTTGIQDAVKLAKTKAGEKNVGISGSDVAQQALRDGLVDEILLNIAPVLLGGGKRLFDSTSHGPLALELISVRTGPCTTHLRYAVKK